MADNTEFDIERYMSLLSQLEATTAVINKPVAQTEEEYDVIKDQIISIDWNTRVVTLPSAYSVYLSIATDHRAATVYFKADRFYDGVDLTQFTFAIEYVNASGEGRIYPVVDFDLTTEKETNQMIFGWKIGHDITKTAGNVQFMVHVFQVDPNNNKYRYSLHTQPCSARILKTLDIDEELGLEDLYGIDASEVQQLFSRLQLLEQKAVVWNDLEGTPDYDDAQSSSGGSNNNNDDNDIEDTSDPEYNGLPDYWK